MLHQIRSEQLLRCTREAAWEFISDPGNLALITPAYMAFEVLRGADQPMYQGQIIEYSVRPVLGIRLHWVTEITHVEPGHYFVDEQRFGPYAFWHHQHRLQEVEKGVLMSDTVHYKLPLGFAGKLADRFMVKKQLADIFSYRRNRLDEFFNHHR